MNKLLARIKNPPVELHPVPFWSWNDRLDPAEVTRQIEAMHSVGIGGYFMHARGGLETEYLGEEWFDCISAGIETGRRLGMQPWVYDEEGWPSGFAGGRVTALGDRYHARGLYCRAVEGPGAQCENLLGIYGETENDFEPCRPGRAYQSYLAVGHTPCPYYIDVLSREAVAAFIQVTHEEYYRRYGDDFGKAMLGFFTDEPRLTAGVTWSHALPDAFRAKYGYNLLERLPALFRQTPDHEGVRCDFWTLVNELFATHFMKQIYDWCDGHGCRLTGHVMMEESLYSQMNGTAGSMACYEHMHLPGVDWLRRSMGNPVMTKQVGSVAEQLGKKRVLTETYALSGWDLRPEEMRWMAAWQYVNGVNLMCQHLEGYTLRGLRKRDYPPSLFTQQPWWPEYRLVNRWFSGIAAALTGGSKIVNFALVHPMRSGYVAYDGANNPRLQRLDDALAGAAERLSGLHLDYHFADEGLLARHGGVDGQGRLTLGDGRYRAVLLPDMLTIAESTLALLEQFTAGGGLVVALGRVPALVDGRPDGRAGRLPLVRYYKDDQLLRLLAPLDDDRVTVRCNGVNCAQVRACRFEDGDARLAFLVNLDKQAAYQAEVSIPGRYAVREVLPENGETLPLPVRHQDGHTVVPFTFEPMRTLLLHMEPAAEDTAPCEQRQGSALHLPLEPGQWTVEAMGLNALTLDTCAYAIDGGAWQPKVAVIRLMRQLLALRRPCALSMRFCFEMGADPARLSTLVLALETPEKFEVTINGAALPQRDEGWIIDTAFKKRDIRALVRQGQNEIVLNTEFFQRQKVYDVLFGEGVYETEENKLTYDTELESLYLFGDFGVYSQGGFAPGERNAITTNGPFVVQEAPATLAPGSFTQQGLLFYPGRLTLGCQIDVPQSGAERVVLQLPAPRAACLLLEVNGQPVQTFHWAPYRADISAYVEPGPNAVRLTLVGGLRNLLGPHHHLDGELYNVGPASFSGEYSWCERPTEATPDLPELQGASFWTDSYCFVTFGIG